MNPHTYAMTHIGYSAMSEWNGVTVKQVYAHGGCGLLLKYDGSLVKALAAMYPYIRLCVAHATVDG